MFSRLLVGLCVVLSLICVVSAYDPRLCVDCMDGMPMPHCPSPSACGYAPVNCTICIPVKTPECKGDIAQDCSVYTCDKCMGGMWMPNCPDPGVCGKTPTPCVGCDVGNVTTCPDPDYCYYPGCVGCVDGQVTANCPDPSVCGYQPACDGCMAGMPMENCPNYDACVMAGADTCMMEMVFNTGHNACVLFSSWNISSGGQWFGTIVAIFFAAFLREFVAFYRSYKLMTRKRAKEAQKYTSVNNKEVRQSLLPSSNGSSSNGTAASVSDSSSKPSPLPYAIDSLLYLAQHTLSYLLMLIIMTYNFYLFLAVVLSFAFWHFSIHYSYAAYFRAKLAPTQQISKNSSSKTTATKDIEEKTGGDHCCEDIDFDE